MSLHIRETTVLHPGKSAGALSGKHVPLQNSLASAPGQHARPTLCECPDVGDVTVHTTLHVEPDLVRNKNLGGL